MSWAFSDESERRRRELLDVVAGLETEAIVLTLRREMGVSRAERKPSHGEPLIWAIDATLWAVGSGGDWRRRGGSCGSRRVTDAKTGRSHSTGPLMLTVIIALGLTLRRLMSSADFAWLGAVGRCDDELDAVAGQTGGSPEDRWRQYGEVGSGRWSSTGSASPSGVPVGARRGSSSGARRGRTAVRGAWSRTGLAA